MDRWGGSDEHASNYFKDSTVKNYGIMGKFMIQQVCCEQLSHE